MNTLPKSRGTAWAVALALVLVPLTGIAPAAADDAPPAIEVEEQTVGTPTISGTPRVGQVLTVEPGVWAPEATFTFQWSRDGVVIPEATEATYALTVADIGTTLTVAVTGSIVGAEPTTVVSEPTEPVDLGAFLSTTVPIVEGEARVGGTLTATLAGWTPAAAYTYQWLRNGVAIAAATDSTYSPGVGDLNAELSVAVTGVADGYAATTTTSQPTDPIAQGVFAASPVPTITGTAEVGKTLTANAGTWSPSASFTYAWYRDGTAIADATKATYVLTPADVAKTITVQVTGVADGYAATTTTSLPTAPVAQGVFAASPVPTITGTVQVGKTLTAKVGTWSPSASFTYAWYRNGTAIAGATKATYVLTPSDLAKTITVQVTGVADGYGPTVRPSSATASVVAGVLSTKVPTVTGTAQVGKTLTAVPGTWTPTATFTYQWYRSGKAISGATRSTYAVAAADLGKAITVKVTGTSVGYTTAAKTSAATAAVKAGVLTAPAPALSTPRVGAKTTVTLGTWTAGTTRTYQWYVGGKAVTGTRGTASTLTPTAAERGKTITVKVTGKKSGYTTVTRTAAAKTIGYGIFAAPAPTISGTAKVGQTLTVARGAWSPAASTYTYQWRANGTAIKGATGTSFKLTTAQRGKTITVTVTGKRTAYSTKSMTSAATGVVQQNFTTAPLPTITGTAKVGQTLTAKPGAWFPAAQFTYQWRANGTAIAGATAATFKLTDAQWGKKITVSVVGRATNYVTTTKTSAATVVVVKAFAASPTPTISGTVRVNSTLTAKPGTWSPAASFSYQWKANGVAIAGATASTFKLTTAQHGKTITVSVTGKATNYATTTRTSAATAAVAWPVGITTPVITSQPADDVATSGTTASFAVGATGGGLTYQWQVSTDDGKTWTNMSGKTSATLTFTVRTSHYLNRYRVVVKNMVKSVTSSAAILYVNSTINDPYKPGNTVVHNAWATWTGPTSRWRYNATHDVVAANAEACYYGDATGWPSWDLDWEYVGSNGVVYDNTYAGSYEFWVGDIWDAPEVYRNGCVSFGAYAIVPRGVVAGGVWRVTDSTEWEYTDIQFIDGA